MDRYHKPIWYMHRDGYELQGSAEATAEALQREAYERDKAEFVANRRRQERVQIALRRRIQERQ